MTGSGPTPTSTPSRRDLEKRIVALEGGDGDPQEVPDVSLSLDEKEALDEAFDVDPETMKQA